MAASVGGGAAHAGLSGLRRTHAIAGGLAVGGAGGLLIEHTRRDYSTARSQSAAQRDLQWGRAQSAALVAVGVSALTSATPAKGRLGAVLAISGGVNLALGGVRLIGMTGEKGSDRTDLPE